mgnify:FL=1
MSKKSKKVVDTTAVRALDPKDPDTKYMGTEPLFALQPDPDLRKSALMRALSWYSRFYGRKDAKDLLVQYLDLTGHKEEAKTMKKVDESELMMSWCWMARLKLRGLVLTEHEEMVLESEIGRLLKSVYKPEIKISQTSISKQTEEKEPVNRPSVQEIMKEKAREAAGELEGLFDTYITSGVPTRHTLRPIDEVAKKNVLPQHISILTEVWKKKLDEFEAVLEGKDAQLVQGYNHLTKTQIKNIVKFIELVLNDLNSYISVKKAAKAPRARKAVPVEKQVSKLKFLKEFKDTATKLDLVSLHPVKLHGASEAWVYDTAKRKLHHYIADEYSKTFTVKGNTLLGFDTAKSEIKTLRKPNEQIKEIMGSKPAARKYFESIKSVGVQPNGRFNENMIILRAF